MLGERQRRGTGKQTLMTCWVFEELQREWKLIFRGAVKRVRHDAVVQLLYAIAEHRLECNLCRPELQKRGQLTLADSFDMIAEQYISEIDRAIARLEQARALLSDGEALQDGHSSVSPSN